jgi:hypothetical protein
MYIIVENNLFVVFLNPTIEYRKTNRKVSLPIIALKGQYHEIFDVWFYSWISFPQATEYTLGRFQFFSTIRRDLSQLKVHQQCRWHRWQKISTQKFFFNYFVWTPLGSSVNKYIHFCLQVHFKVFAAWYCSHYSIVPGVVDTGGASWLANISANVRKSSKWP